MHIFNSIFVHFVQFLMLDYGLDHFTSQSFIYSLWWSYLCSW